MSFAQPTSHPTAPQALAAETFASLAQANTLSLPAVAQQLWRLRSEADVRQWVNQRRWEDGLPIILGGGSNVVLAGDLAAPVLKVEIAGKRLADEDDNSWLIEVGAGESWPGLVSWTLENGWPGLENLALIPGTVGAAPVQNIGAYGLEVQDRLDSVDVVDLVTGRSATLTAAQCRFAYRDSIFKAPHALAGKSLITRVRFRLPKRWQAVLGYQDIEQKIVQTGITQPSARQIYDWICEIRQRKLPDPAVLPNAGSFFKNPVVSAEQCQKLLDRDPHLVHYLLDDGQFKLAAGWLIDSCGWRGKTMGGAAVHGQHALVLVNKGGATGAEIGLLAQAIQSSVWERFGVLLEPEPVFLPQAFSSYYRAPA